MLPWLIREQAEAAGKTMSVLWLVRHHLWFSPSRLQQEDQACLMKLPAEPSAMVGQKASSLLLQVEEARRCARKLSGTFGCCQGGCRSVTPPPGQMPSATNWRPKVLFSSFQGQSETRRPALGTDGSNGPNNSLVLLYMPLVQRCILRLWLPPQTRLLSTVHGSPPLWHISCGRGHFHAS